VNRSARRRNVRIASFEDVFDRCRQSCREQRDGSAFSEQVLNRVGDDPQVVGRFPVDLVQGQQDPSAAVAVQVGELRQLRPQRCGDRVALGLLARDCTAETRPPSG